MKPSDIILRLAGEIIGGSKVVELFTIEDDIEEIQPADGCKAFHRTGRREYRIVVWDVDKALSEVTYGENPR